MLEDDGLPSAVGFRRVKILIHAMSRGATRLPMREAMVTGQAKPNPTISTVINYQAKARGNTRCSKTVTRTSASRC